MDLEFIDLSGTADETQRFELEFTDLELPALDFHFHHITFSPDLSMLQAGTDIFDLSAADLEPLCFPDSPLGDLAQSGVPCVSFSSSNEYLVVNKDVGAAAGAAPAMLGLFRTCRPAGMVERLAIAGLEDLVADAILANFHPMLPLLVLTYITHQLDVEVIEVDLQELKQMPLAIPEQYIAVLDA